MRPYTCKHCGKTTYSAGIAASCAYCGEGADCGNKTYGTEEERPPFLQQLKRRIIEAYGIE